MALSYLWYAVKLIYWAHMKFTTPAQRDVLRIMLFVLALLLYASFIYGCAPGKWVLDEVGTTYRYDTSNEYGYRTRGNGGEVNLIWRKYPRGTWSTEEKKDGNDK